MKLLLVFPPFHAPTSPPFGLAYLKGALAASNPDVTVRVQDWNQAFFRRWMLEEVEDLCDLHPGAMIGMVCPATLVADGRGRQMWETLTRIPADEREQAAYMRAARGMDALFNALAALYSDILQPWVEGRAQLPDAVIERLFGAELARVEAEAPDLIGFSILSEHNLLYALAVARAVKERFGIPVLLGGAMMAHLEADELLNAFPWLDFIFSGEAEQSLSAFLQTGPDGDLEHIPGLTHRRGREVCRHSQPPQIPLAELPDPDFSDYDLDAYLAPEPVLPIITSRGCYWGKCTFCSHTLPYGGGVRVRKPDAVLDEMSRQMERYGVRTFLFVDEAISPRMLRHLSEGILARGLDVRFGAEGIRVEEAFSQDLLRSAHQAGLRWIYVGIESSVQRLLDLIEKGIRIEAIERLIADCREVGIVPELSFIIGLPTTTVEELQQELDFMRRYAVDSSTYVLLYGSPMHLHPERFGIRIEAREALFITGRGVVHSPRFHFTVEQGLSPVQADYLVESAPAGARMRPHLGEVHATLLADSGYFNETSRPEDLPDAPALAIEALQADDARRGTADWYVHLMSALEAAGRHPEAFTIGQGALASVHPKERDRLYLHLAAILNYADQPQQALAALQRVGRSKSLRPALLAEQLRAHFALENARGVRESAERMHALGYEIPMSWAMLGLAYEAEGRYRKAIEALERAEQRTFFAPDINEALARCHARRGADADAAREREKAVRKAAHLEPPVVPFFGA